MLPVADTVIVIPTLNEADHIGPVLDGLLLDGVSWPIWVVDGGSSDGTDRIVAQYAAALPNVRLMRNPDRSQATAVNLAAGIAQRQGMTTLIRMDAHARYPAGFVEALQTRLAQTGADSVTTPLVAQGSGLWQSAAAALQRGWLGHGGAPHRSARRGGWVDHGHHAAFRLAAFNALGGYDPAFEANEDVEFDMRLLGAGGRIWLDPALAVTYRPRPTPRALWRQMRRNGRWRMETALKHRRLPGLRQILPVLATLGAGGSAGTGIVLHPAFALPSAAYLALVLTLALHSGGPRLGPFVACLALVAHLGFGTGALERLGRTVLARPRGWRRA